MATGRLFQTLWLFLAIWIGSSDGRVRMQIFQNADLSGLIGAKLYIGYGTDPDEMLRAGRYRDIFTVSQSAP